MGKKHFKNPESSAQSRAICIIIISPYDPLSLLVEVPLFLSLFIPIVVDDDDYIYPHVTNVDVDKNKYVSVNFVGKSSFFSYSYVGLLHI